MSENTPLESAQAAPAPSTTNRFAVCGDTTGTRVLILGMTVLSQRMAAGGLDEDEVLNLAAWLVSLCPGPFAVNKFVHLYDAVSKT